MMNKEDIKAKGEMGFLFPGGGEDCTEEKFEHIQEFISKSQ